MFDDIIIYHYLDETFRNNLHEDHADLGSSAELGFLAILAVQLETHKMSQPNHYWLEHHDYSCLRPKISNFFIQCCFYLFLFAFLFIFVFVFVFVFILLYCAQITFFSQLFWNIL